MIAIQGRKRVQAKESWVGYEEQESKEKEGKGIYQVFPQKQEHK
jgi:hypothetical protein